MILLLALCVIAVSAAPNTEYYHPSAVTAHKYHRLAQVSPAVHVSQENPHLATLIDITEEHSSLGPATSAAHATHEAHTLAKETLDVHSHGSHLSGHALKAAQPHQDSAQSNSAAHFSGEHHGTAPGDHLVYTSNDEHYYHLPPSDHIVHVSQESHKRDGTAPAVHKSPEHSEQHSVSTSSHATPKGHATPSTVHGLRNDHGKALPSGSAPVARVSPKDHLPAPGHLVSVSTQHHGLAPPAHAADISHEHHPLAQADGPAHGSHEYYARPPGATIVPGQPGHNASSLTTPTRYTTVEKASVIPVKSSQSDVGGNHVLRCKSGDSVHVHITPAREEGPADVTHRSYSFPCPEKEHFHIHWGAKEHGIHAADHHMATALPAPEHNHGSVESSTSSKGHHTFIQKAGAGTTPSEGAQYLGY